MVHSEQEAQKCLEAAKAVFGAKSTSADMPTTTLADNDFTDGIINILEILEKAKLCPSKSEARRLVIQGGITVNDDKVESPAFSLSKDDFADGYIVVKKGKKIFHKIIIE